MATVWEGTYLSLQIIVPSSKEKQLDPENHPFFSWFHSSSKPESTARVYVKFYQRVNYPVPLPFRRYGTWIHTHRIHGAAIYGNIYHQYTPNVSIYIYIYTHTWILCDRDGLINSPWGPIPCSRATTHGWVKPAPRRRSGHFLPVQKKAKDEANDPSGC